MQRVRFIFIQICCLLLVTVATYGQKKNKAAVHYINRYSKLAIDNMEKYGIPASITMAQGLLESGFGESELAKKSNNHFGIKCKSNWKGKRVYHDDDEKGECFRKYSSVEDSYTDHAIFLSSSPRYASLFDLPHGDYKAWAKGLKKAGYATNPKYAELLINTVNTYELFKLDKAKRTRLSGEVKVKNLEESIKLKSRKEQRSDDVVGAYIISGRRVYRQGKSLFIYGVEGDDFKSLAQVLKISKGKLKRYNSQLRVINTGDKVYLNSRH